MNQKVQKGVTNDVSLPPHHTLHQRGQQSPDRNTHTKKESLFFFLSLYIQTRHGLLNLLKAVADGRQASTVFIRIEDEGFFHLELIGLKKIICIHITLITINKVEHACIVHVRVVHTSPHLKKSSAFWIRLLAF